MQNCTPQGSRSPAQTPNQDIVLTIMDLAHADLQSAGLDPIEFIPTQADYLFYAAFVHGAQRGEAEEAVNDLITRLQNNLVELRSAVMGQGAAS